MCIWTPMRSSHAESEVVRPKMQPSEGAVCEFGHILFHLLLSFATGSVSHLNVPTELG